MSIRIRQWHAIVIVVFLALVLVGIIVVALQASAETKAEGPVPDTVAHATSTSTPTQGWWITVTQQWDDRATPVLTSTDGCIPGSQYVADVTIPDGTSVDPREGFSKTWKVKNSGTCNWHAGFELAFVSGDRMGGPESVSLPEAPVGEEADVLVDLVAPDKPGMHKATWRMRAQNGEMFGTHLTVVIEVSESGTAITTIVSNVTLPSATLDARP